MHQKIEDLARWLFESANELSWDALTLSETPEVQQLVAKWREIAASSYKIIVRPSAFRHKKGGLYTFVGWGRSTVDLSPHAVYIDDTGELWIRPKEEFIDGRFVPLTLGT